MSADKFTDANITAVNVVWTDEVTDNPRTVTADVNGTIYTAVFEAIG